MDEKGCSIGKPIRLQYSRMSRQCKEHGKRCPEKIGRQRGAVAVTDTLTGVRVPKVAGGRKSQAGDTSSPCGIR
jgi:hypothetical protein